MKTGLPDQIIRISESIGFLLPELILCFGLVLLLIGSLLKKLPVNIFSWTTLLLLITYLVIVVILWPSAPISLLAGMMRHDDFSSFLKILMGTGGVLTILIDSFRKRTAEYFLLLLAIILGADFLVMSSNLVMVVLSLELISIPSYVLTTGLLPEKKRAEGAWKYFLFGSASTAVMIFGMSYLFGLSGTLDFTSEEFIQNLSGRQTPLLLVGGMMTLSGFLFKISAVPFHFWAPDVYESAPTPVVAFFSVVPKLAGLGIITKFVLAIHLFGQSAFNWSLIIGSIALLSILVGNLIALSQKDAKRMMAYSSIAQAGFLLAAVSTITLEGVRIALFYSGVFVIMNFLTFLVLIEAEEKFQSTEMKTFTGWGHFNIIPALGILVGLISLTGLPPTGGFMAKLFLFSALWEKFSETGSTFYAWLFGTGLLATVVSLFFYLKIPFYLFMRSSAQMQKNPGEPNPSSLKRAWANLLTLILVILLLVLFFYPGLLMGWANKVNFVL